MSQKSQSKKHETGKNRQKENEGFAQCTGQSVAHSLKKQNKKKHTAPPFTWPALLTEPLHHRQAFISDHQSQPTVGLHLKTSGEQLLET